MKINLYKIKSLEQLMLSTEQTLSDFRGIIDNLKKMPPKALIPAEAKAHMTTKQ
jgi:hypothetical protein